MNLMKLITFNSSRAKIVFVHCTFVLFLRKLKYNESCNFQNDMLG